jgi:hypothetical protein
MGSPKILSWITFLESKPRLFFLTKKSDPAENFRTAHCRLALNYLQLDDPRPQPNRNRFRP